MEGKLKILETNQQSEEITPFYPIFSYIYRLLQQYVEQNCHVLVSTIFTSISSLDNTYNGKKFKILETNQKSEDITHAFIPYFVHLGTFIVISLTGNVHVSLVLRHEVPESVWLSIGRRPMYTFLY